MEKIVIYQVFTRLFGNNKTSCVHNGSIEENGVGKMADFTLKALEQIKSLGATHIWYTGLIEHATQTDYTSFGIEKDHPAVVKGKAGSPYAIKDYYDIDPDLATSVPNRMKEFENLVQRTHRAGLKFVIDFVPNHVARQYKSDSAPEGVKNLGEDDNKDFAFSNQNNFYYIPGTQLNAQFDLKDYIEFPARATGNDNFSAYPGINDWYETVKLNYGVDYAGGRTNHFDPIPDTWNKMLHILLFWAGKKVDAFRCDMAEMVPVDFWHWAIPQVKEQYSHVIFIAEVYNPAEYRNYLHYGHFDYLYDKVGLYDTLKAVTNDWISAQNITFSWQQVEGIRNNMLNFLENHDEQRLASKFFAGNPLKGKAPLLVSALMYTNPMMVYFGQEFGEPGMDAEGFSGEDGRTTIFDYWSVDTIRRWRNNGKFDNKQLTADELSLQAYYAKVLNICNSSEAVREGEFYDLMYVNPQLQRQYAFVRHTENETLLIVANFAAHDAEVSIHVPQHLFEYYQIEESTSSDWMDLLTGDSVKASFTSAEATKLNVPAWGGFVLRMKEQKKTKCNKSKS